MAILTFDWNGVPLWRTFYGGSGHEESPAEVAAYSTYLYVAGNSPRSLPTSHLPNPGGGAYYDDSPNGGYDAVLLRSDFANCPLSYPEAGEEEKIDRNTESGSWQAWWDGVVVRVAGVVERGWYGLLSMDGRVVGRWYVEGDEGVLRGSWSPGLYVVYKERSGEARRVWVEP